MWTWDLSGVRWPWRQTVTLVNDAHTLRVDGDAAYTARRRKTSPSAPSGVCRRTSASAIDWPGAPARYGPATVFLLDGRAYLETGGSWIVGGASAEFAVGPRSRRAHPAVRAQRGDRQHGDARSRPMA